MLVREQNDVVRHDKDMCLHEISDSVLFYRCSLTRKKNLIYVLSGVSVGFLISYNRLTM